MDFICTASIDGILSWSSECYIGDGGRSIAFTSTTSNGTRQNSTTDQSVYAVLNCICNDGTLNSSLYIGIIKEGPCTIICSTSKGLQRNVTIQKLGNM